MRVTRKFNSSRRARQCDVWHFPKYVHKDHEFFEDLFEVKKSLLSYPADVVANSSFTCLWQCVQCNRSKTPHCDAPELTCTSCMHKDFLQATLAQPTCKPFHQTLHKTPARQMPHKLKHAHTKTWAQPRRAPIKSVNTKTTHTTTQCQARSQNTKYRRKSISGHQLRTKSIERQFACQHRLFLDL